MHETLIANQIIDEAKKHGKVVSIKVEVGDLAHLPMHDMEHTLKEMCKGLGWEVECVRKPALVKCICGYEGEPKILEKGHDVNVFECPTCGSIPEILEGKDIILLSVEVE